MTEVELFAEWKYPDEKPDDSGFRLSHKAERLAFIAGYNLCKEQMLKEAVEGEVMLNPYPTICLNDCKDYDFKDGDKVRIIIVKED